MRPASVDGDADLAARRRRGRSSSESIARRRHRLQPDGLPDAGDRRVQDAARLEHLLAARLGARVGRVPDRDDELLRRRPASDASVMSNVNGVVAAAVLAELLAVDADGRLPVDRAEVQQHRACPARGLRAASNVRRYQSRWSGLTGFITPQRADSTGNGTRIWPSNDRTARPSSLGADRVVPQAVQVHPFGPDHLRPGILRVDLAGIDLRRPARFASGPRPAVSTSLRRFTGAWPRSAKIGYMHESYS